LSPSSNRILRPPFGRLIGACLSLGITVFGIRAAIAASAAGKGKEDLPGYHSPLPITEPRLFSDAQVSTADFESHPAFNLADRVVYFVKSTPNRRFGTILSSRYEGAWSAPTVLSFSGKYSDRAPFLTPDATRLYYSSDRPAEDYLGAVAKQDFDIWYVERKADSTWSKPKSVGATVNGPGNEGDPALAADGTLYFSSDRAGGRGMSDLWRCRSVNGAFGPAEHLGDSVNTAGSESDPRIAPDQSYMIFTSDRPGGRGGSDLYVSNRRGDHWSTPVNLGEPVNSMADEFAPCVSPDGEYFFWTSCRSFADATRDPPWDYPDLLARLRRTRNGLGDIYQIDLSALGIRP